ncbi:MAG TPA: aminotransferase class V-fold PLP-dependent enzyme, partial [bacterium]|nr:aminotransferase class V-fold PLP-dependent enzyme [bacterium]
MQPGTPGTRHLGDRRQRVATNANFGFDYIEGESLLLSLDMKGICASSGSACTSGSLEPSHVLLALGLPHEVAHGSLRFSLGKYSTESDVEAVAAVLPEIVAKLRAMSPLWPKER